MDDLAAFIAARLDEDEQAAPGVHGDGCALHAWLRNDVPAACDCGWPARLLREAAAKRVILDGWKLASEGAHSTGYLKTLWLYRAICAIAAIWSDHPDYRAGWAPGHG